MKKANVYKNTSQKTYDLTDEQRAEYKTTSSKSRLKRLQYVGEGRPLVREINVPKLDPHSLMPKQLLGTKPKALSLFSGGGGLDLGFDLAGYEHLGSYDLIPICGETLSRNRPNWRVFAGPEAGDVSKIDWDGYAGEVDVIHGGPPCQPFSVAGQQKGQNDERNMWPEFARAVNTIKPKAFVGENVLGMKGAKFDTFIQAHIFDAMPGYDICSFSMNASEFGVPQIRKRIFFVGIKKHSGALKFSVPKPTHSNKHLIGPTDPQSNFLDDKVLEKTVGVREALGLQRLENDALAPTLRSGFTGKRNTTSILNSSAGQKTWADLGIWPNGVQSTRETAAQYPADNGNFRLSVQDCALLQGFPEDWVFQGAAYQVLGQIGNSVAPPVAYQVAVAVYRSIAKNL